jgi:hypothetical protein
MRKIPKVIWSGTQEELERCREEAAKAGRIKPEYIKKRNRTSEEIAADFLRKQQENLEDIKSEICNVRDRYAEDSIFKFTDCENYKKLIECANRILKITGAQSEKTTVQLKEIDGMPIIKEEEISEEGTAKLEGVSPENMRSRKPEEVALAFFRKQQINLGNLRWSVQELIDNDGSIVNSLFATDSYKKLITNVKIMLEIMNNQIGSITTHEKDIVNILYPSKEGTNATHGFLIKKTIV